MDLDLIATRIGHVGVIALNRPNARNALTLDMVEAFQAALEDFGSDSCVKAVVVKSTGEGIFCAGGDVRAICQARNDGRHAEADRFFAREFALNERIAGFEKPYVALIDGVCFGGGMGISVHGSHRVVGERALLAMPETAIGYFPDVGASHFLNRLPLPIARFLGLTGYVLSPADALFTGLATHFVAGVHHGEVEPRLADGEPIEMILGVSAPLESRLAQNIDVLDRCFADDDISSIVGALRRERGGFAAEALERLLRAAPSSLDATLGLLKRTRGLALGQCLAIELDLALRVTRGRDFAEGVRALLVDKDRHPRWASVDLRVFS
ncbi:MAG: enoyl-CoA hydratase/isomerase family protein [Mesorhizobium sp.]|nr:enoyl-CoA hydratase/isomerase family protein [Mesorhizobium sp.]MCO5162497.1 enoyl-CoA hydratase/isomerase family protein [Mesorhizobium sp.]